MDSGSKIQNRLDESARFRTLSMAFLSFAALIAFVVAYPGMARGWFGATVLDLALLPIIFVLASSAACYVLASMEFKMHIEEEERILLEKRKDKSALEVGEDVLFVARRSRDNFRKYAPYVVSGVEIAAAAVFLVLYHRYIGKRIEAPSVSNHAPAAFVSLAIALLCLFFGVFAVGQSRVRAFRWFRVPGAWLILSFAIFASASVSILLIKSGRPEWDGWIRNFFMVVLAATGVELLLNFIMEFYRPRGEMEERPVFESRILALFTEPGGLMRNVAETLDYQFGFKISGTWLYKMVETSLIPLLILWMFSLWTMTCFVQIYPNELGVRESFGVLEKGEPLTAGIHFKLPYPYGRIIRIPADDIQEVYVGTGADEKSVAVKPEKDTNAILWTVMHYEKEANFLVASDKSVSENETPVSFISSVFNIQYRIGRKGLLDYYYGNQDARKTIKAVSEAVIVKFLAGKDMLKMLSLERKSNKALLADLLQKAYDRHGLGIEVLFVNILDVHPPVEKVAPSFQNVVGAIEEKEADILKAKEYENKTIPMAEAEGARVVLDAETGSRNAVTLAQSENERFMKQLLAYRQMPGMFMLRTYLDFFENECAKVRKVVVASDLAHNVFILNLEEKQRLDLLDVPLADLAPEKK